MKNLVPSLGLQRVREMSLNDGHTFVAPEQIQGRIQEDPSIDHRCL